MYSIYPVFISILEPSTLNTFSGHEPTPDPLVILDREPEYEISEILDSRIDKCHKCKLQYLVYWAGYKGTDEETSWVPASELGHALEVISDFHQTYLEKSSCSLFLALLYFSGFFWSFPRKKLIFTML